MTTTSCQRQGCPLSPCYCLPTLAPTRHCIHRVLCDSILPNIFHPLFVRSTIAANFQSKLLMETMYSQIWWHCNGFHRQFWIDEIFLVAQDHRGSCWCQLVLSLCSETPIASQKDRKPTFSTSFYVIFTGHHGMFRVFGLFRRLTFSSWGNLKSDHMLFHTLHTPNDRPWCPSSGFLLFPIAVDTMRSVGNTGIAPSLLAERLSSASSSTAMASMRMERMESQYLRFVQGQREAQFSEVMVHCTACSQVKTMEADDMKYHTIWNGTLHSLLTGQNHGSKWHEIPNDMRIVRSIQGGSNCCIVCRRDAMDVPTALSAMTTAMASTPAMTRVLSATALFLLRRKHEVFATMGDVVSFLTSDWNPGESFMN